MRRNNTVSPLLWAALTLPVLYLAALLASGYEEGMTVFDLMGRFSELLERPFAIRWTPHTPKFMLGALLIYGFSVVIAAFGGDEFYSPRYASAFPPSKSF